MQGADPAIVIVPLSLANMLTVLMAIACLWTMAPQSRGGVIRLWRLAMPGGYAAVVALMLLSGVVEVTLIHDAEWLLAMMLGGLVGRTRGWTLAVDIDQTFGLVRLPRTVDGVVAALGVLAMALVDFAMSAVEEPLVAPVHVAAGSALFAGYLGFRAVAIIVRSNRAPHVGLRDAAQP